MALFGTQRDAKFMASINSEIMNQVVDTKIEFYKLIVEESESNLYGESDKKSFYQSILIPALITKEGKNANQDDYGHNYITEKILIEKQINQIHLKLKRPAKI